MDLAFLGILVRMNKILSNSPVRNAWTRDLRALTIPWLLLFEAVEMGREMVVGLS